MPSPTQDTAPYSQRQAKRSPQSINNKCFWVSSSKGLWTPDSVSVKHACHLCETDMVLTDLFLSSILSIESCMYGKVALPMW